ncbi:MAG: hypothetical protein ACO21H_00705 [Sediminibacterium sp.]
MARVYKDFTNQRFGFIEVIGKNGVAGHNTIWKCFCHNCNSYKDLISPLLNSRRKSCGCYKLTRGSKSPYWKGVGDIPKVYLNQLKNNASKRNLEYNISKEYLWDLFEKQEKKCALSGIDLIFGRFGRDNITASLDRINSSIGYVEGNVQWVHKHVNYMKLNHTQEYFLELCNKIIEYNKNKQI